jgi:hypothetical protein
MKNDKLIPGVILVLIGAAILLANYGYLHFHWWNIFRLWPIFLVIGGINLLFAHNKSPWATILKISVVVFGFGLVLFGNFGDRYSFWPGNHFSWNHHNNNDDNDDNNMDDNDDDDNSDKGDVKAAVNGAFNEPYNANIKVARLNVSGGATSYYLSGTTDQLFSAASRDVNRYTFSTSKDEDSVYVVNFHMKDRNGVNFDSDKSRADFSLNTNPIWEIHADAGAAKLDFDLSKFKVKELKLNGAAGSFSIKLGDPLAETNVEISNVASDVNINIPQSAACSIETDSGLSDNHFEGFNKNDDDNYETAGYATAKNKIHIHIKGLVSGFKVNRY